MVGTPQVAGYLVGIDGEHAGRSPFSSRGMPYGKDVQSRGDLYKRQMEKAIQFVIKKFGRPQQQRERNGCYVAVRVCAGCLHDTPACLAR